MGLFLSFISVDQEHVFACYNLMLEFQKRKMKIPNSEITSSDLSSIHASTVDVLDAASFISLSSKRRMYEYDRNGRTADQKRLC